MIIFNEQTEKWREKLIGSGSDMMMVGGLSLMGRLPNTDFVLFFFFLVITIQLVTNEKEIHLEINNRRWLIDNHNSLSIQHEIKTCITGKNSNTQRNNNYSSNYMTNSNSFRPPPVLLCSQTLCLRLIFQQIH